MWTRFVTCESSVQLEDGYIWSIEAESQDSPFLSYHIAIDKRNGRIIHLIVKKLLLSDKTFVEI